MLYFSGAVSHLYVCFHYILRNTRGEVVDSSRGGSPLQSVLGFGQLIDGLEEILPVLPLQETTRSLIAAEKAYGLRDSTLLQKVPRDSFPADEVRVGDMFQTDSDRHSPIVRVVAVEGDNVVIDANHPLADEDLEFEIELLERRPAKESELPSAHQCCGGGCHGHG